VNTIIIHLFDEQIFFSRQFGADIGVSGGVGGSGFSVCACTWPTNEMNYYYGRCVMMLLYKKKKKING